MNDGRHHKLRRKVVLAVCLVAALALPAGAAAKPTKQDRQNAAKECKLLRGTTDATREAFRAQYRNLGACVSAKAREEAAERKAARRNAVRDCRTERAADEDAFAENYRNFGRCVSAAVKRELRAEDREDREDIADTNNAAEGCAAEREAVGQEPFNEEYGTNKNKKNAFGKCVSAHSDDGTDEEPEEDNGGEEQSTS